MLCRFARFVSLRPKQKQKKNLGKSVYGFIKMLIATKEQ